MPSEHYCSRIALTPQERVLRGSTILGSELPRSSSVFCSLDTIYSDGVLMSVHNCTVFERNGQFSPFGNEFVRDHEG